MPALHCGGVGVSLQWLLCCRAWTREHMGASVVVMHKLSCPVARGIFWDQGSNLGPLHEQTDSYPLDYQGGLTIVFLTGSPKSESCAQSLHPAQRQSPDPNHPSDPN